MENSTLQIQQAVTAAVARSLACDEDEVTSGSGLVNDLGMDSLDFLDVIFSLEKTFQIKLLSSEINKLLRPDRSQPEERHNLHLGPEEMAGLAPFIPALETAVADGVPILRKDLFQLITTQTLVALVSHEVAKKAESQ